MQTIEINAQTNLMRWMQEGGWVMWALLLFSVAAVATSLHRVYVLRRAKLDVSAYSKQLRHALLEQKSVQAALELSQDAPGPVAAVASTALHVFDRPVAKIEKSMERCALREQRQLYRGMGILATISTTAPLLGFLGTVTGMMASFDILAGHGISNPGLVAVGIKEALTTTAAGLIVAVPTQLVYNALLGRIEKIQGDMETVGNFLLELREEVV